MIVNPAWEPGMGERRREDQSGERDSHCITRKIFGHERTGICPEQLTPVPSHLRPLSPHGSGSGQA